jgi:hypothetical protein
MLWDDLLHTACISERHTGWRYIIYAEVNIGENADGKGSPLISKKSGIHESF